VTGMRSFWASVKMALICSADPALTTTSGLAFKKPEYKISLEGGQGKTGRLFYTLVRIHFTKTTRLKTTITKKVYLMAG